jgi:hypothetical protein
MVCLWGERYINAMEYIATGSDKCEDCKLFWKLLCSKKQ